MAIALKSMLRWARLLVAVAVCLALIPALGAFSTREQIVPLGQAVRYDDFEFSVTGVRRAAALGTGDHERAAEGVFVIVRLKLNNRAKRVSYRLDPAIAVLIDGQGREYGLARAAQRLLDEGQEPAPVWPVVIPKGQAYTAELAFDVPRSARNVRLRIGKGGIGVFLDNLLIGRKRFEVPLNRAASGAGAGRRTGPSAG